MKIQEAKWGTPKNIKKENLNKGCHKKVGIYFINSDFISIDYICLMSYSTKKTY